MPDASPHKAEQVDPAPRWTFSLLGLFELTTFMALLSWAYTRDVIDSLYIALFCLPAALRTSYLLWCRRSGGRTISRLDTGLAYFESFVVTILALGAGASAAFIFVQSLGAHFL